MFTRTSSNKSVATRGASHLYKVKTSVVLELIPKELHSQVRWAEVSPST